MRYGIEGIDTQEGLALLLRFLLKLYFEIYLRAVFDLLDIRILFLCTKN